MDVLSFLKNMFKPSEPEAVKPDDYQESAGYLPTRGNWAGQGAPYGLSSSGDSPVLDHQELRTNARSAYHDSDQARMLIERLTDSVVDKGLKLEPTPDFEKLGIAPEEARTWAKNTEKDFAKWATNKVSRDKSMSLYQVQRLAEMFQHRDGESFLRFYYSSDPSLLNPLQLEFVEPDQICGDTETDTQGYNDHDVGDGIIRDGSGREVAYKVATYNKTNNTYKESVIRAWTKGGLRLMAHGYRPEYAGQKRGYSRISHQLQGFENITNFTDSTIKKADSQSAVTFTVESSDDAPATNPFADLQDRYNGAGPAACEVETPGASTSTEGGVDLQDSIQYCAVPEATINRGGVGVFNLQGRQKLVPFKNTTPGEPFENFLNAYVSHMSASSGVPIEVLLMKFGQNYSASRATLIMYQQVVEIWRSELESDILGPIYEAWLTGEIAAGRISAPGFSDPHTRAAWLSCNWIGAPMPDIDPLKSAKAKKEFVELGATSLGRVAREHNGSSYEDNAAKLRDEVKVYPEIPWSKSAAPAQGQQDNEEEEEGEDNGKSGDDGSGS